MTKSQFIYFFLISNLHANEIKWWKLINMGLGVISLGSNVNDDTYVC